MTPIEDRGLFTGVHARGDGTFAVLLVSYDPVREFDPDEFPFPTRAEALAFVSGIELAQDGRLDVVRKVEFDRLVLDDLESLAARSRWADSALEDLLGYPGDRFAGGGARERIRLAIDEGDDIDWIRACLSEPPPRP